MVWETEILDKTIGAYHLCWLLPFIGAVLAPLFALIHPKVRDWMGVVFIGGGMAAAISLLPDADINKAFGIKWLPIGMKAENCNTCKTPYSSTPCQYTWL